MLINVKLAGVVTATLRWIVSVYSLQIHIGKPPPPSMCAGYPETLHSSGNQPSPSLVKLAELLPGGGGGGDRGIVVVTQWFGGSHVVIQEYTRKMLRTSMGRAFAHTE